MKVIVTAGIIKYRCRNSNKKEEEKKAELQGLVQFVNGDKRRNNWNKKPAEPWSIGVEDVSQNKDTNQKKPKQISQIKLTQWTQNVIFSAQAIVITHSGEENPVRWL